MALMAASASCSRLLSSLHLSPRGISGNYGLLRIRTVVSQRPFSPLPEIRASPDPIDFSGRCLRFGGWNEMLRRRGSKGGELGVPAAAAADADGLGFVTPSFVFLSCLVGWKMEEKKKSHVN